PVKPSICRAPLARHRYSILTNISASFSPAWQERIARQIIFRFIRSSKWSCIHDRAIAVYDEPPHVNKWPNNFVGLERAFLNLIMNQGLDVMAHSANFLPLTSTTKSLKPYRPSSARSSNNH